LCSTYQYSGRIIKDKEDKKIIIRIRKIKIRIRKIKIRIRKLRR
jgi:hypothetical protein